MSPDIHPTRHFSATTNTLSYLIEEWAEDRFDEEALQVARELVAKAEGDIFEERKCSECNEVILGTDEENANNRLKDHKQVHK